MLRYAWVIACLGCRGSTEPPRDLKTVVELRTTPLSELDLLFVVDDTTDPSVQLGLGDALPSLFDRLSPSLDLHVGVTTTDLGTSTTTGDVAPDIGAVGSGGCSGLGKAGNLTVGDAQVAGTFLSDVAMPDGTRQRNFDGPPASLVREMIRVGVTGCGFEQPLAAMRAALDDNPANAGFVQRNSVLAVVFLTDEDDCSVRDPALFGSDSPTNPQTSFRCTRFGVQCLDGGVTPDDMAVPGPKQSCRPNTTQSAQLEAPELFRDFLLDLVGDPSRVVAGGVFGNPEPFEVAVDDSSNLHLAAACRFVGADKLPDTSDDQRVVPAVRMNAFAALFGARSSTASLCQADFSASVAELADRVNFALGSPCLIAIRRGLRVHLDA